jgi:hypothetical protein
MLQVEVFSSADCVRGNLAETTREVSKRLKAKVNDWIKTKRSMVEVVDIKFTSSQGITDYSNTPTFAMTASVIYKT